MGGYGGLIVVDQGAWRLISIRTCTSHRLDSVARSRQVCIYVVEALLIACYLPG
jgi:hypothetical protein